MIFNHTAIFPENLWPRQIVTNGHVLMEGAKMSKSFGNIIPLREGLAKFGADPLRLSVLATAELLQDAGFSPSIAKSMRERLERLHKFVAEFAKKKHIKKPQKKLSNIDRWMLSRLQDYIRKATEAMDKLAVRKAIHSIMYELDQEFQWYQERTATQKEESAKTYVISKVLDAEIRMLAPVAPHTCEELWKMIGGKDFVSVSPWPMPDKKYVDVNAEEKETLVMNVLEDTLNIIKATNMKPKKIHYYVAAPWKWKTCLKALGKGVAAKVQQKDLMKELMDDSDLKTKAERVAKFTSQILEEINHMPEERKKRLTQVKIIKESQTLKEAKSFLEKKLNAEIYIYEEEDPKIYDPKHKAQLAKPYRPAIYIE